MKKALFGTSAIAGAAALAAGSAFAGEAPQVTFSGAVAYELQFADGGIENEGTGVRVGGNEQQSEFVWDARGTADNGLEYGANVQWRWMNAGGGNFDESYVDVRGSFGRIYLGGEDGVTDLVAGSSGHSVQVGSWGTDGNNALRNINNLVGDGTFMYYNSTAGQTFDANKIGYVTPNFGGFQAGISYAPQSGDQQVVAGADDDAITNAVDIAAGWGGEVAGVGLKIDGSYQFATNESSQATGAGTFDGTGAFTAATSTSGNELEDINSFMVGGTASFAGFGLGAAYLDNDDSGCNQATINCDDGDAWNIGASYNFGAGSLSAMYQSARQDTDGDGSYNTMKVSHVGASFTIAEGMSAYTNYYYFDMEDTRTTGLGVTTTDGGHAHVLLIGTRVTF